MDRINCHSPLHDGRIKLSTLLLLAHLIEEKYPDKWQFAMEICPVAIIKTVDNQGDAITTIATILNISNLEAAKISARLEYILSDTIDKNITKCLSDLK